MKTKATTTATAIALAIALAFTGNAARPVVTVKSTTTQTQEA